jgi:hypothetical protein
MAAFEARLAPMAAAAKRLQIRFVPGEFRIGPHRQLVIDFGSWAAALSAAPAISTQDF